MNTKKKRTIKLYYFRRLVCIISKILDFSTVIPILFLHILLQKCILVYILFIKYVNRQTLEIVACSDCIFLMKRFSSSHSNPLWGTFWESPKSRVYELSVEKLLQSFDALAARMPIKMHYLSPHLDYFPVIHVSE